MDSAMTTSFEGTPGTPGYKYSWKGNKDVGSGSMTYLGESGDTLKTDLLFMEPFENQALAFHITKPEGEATNVTWGMWMKTPFLGRAMGLFMDMDKTLGTDFEKGLSYLKTKLEAMPAEPQAATFDIKEEQWDEKTFVGNHRLIPFNEMESFGEITWTKTEEELKKKNIEPSMSRCSIYMTWDMEKEQTDVAAVRCVPKGTNLKGFETWNIPAAKVLHVSFVGDPSKTMEAHNAIAAYMKEKNLTAAYTMEESVDPAGEQDVNKWVTNIYYLLK
jgi:hypothetical protein